VRYFANPSTARVREAMTAGRLGLIATPRQGNRHLPGVTWCADTGCYGRGYPGDERWLAWLARLSEHAPQCAFALAPDVPGDAAATLARSRPWLAAIRDLGYPAGYAAQDGQEHLPVPWDECDVLFLAGSTEWKLGPHARRLAAEALGRGKTVHMGRVNSLRRLHYAQQIGCSSVDGTYLTFAPDTNLPILLRWLDTLHASAAPTPTGAPR